jgi:thiamine-monophosphate kinase
MTEFELIERFFTRPRVNAIGGNGDDCAIIAPAADHAFAVTTDSLIEGRHFLPAIDPRKLGRRAVNVNLSDLAAMGAVPRYALLSLTLPQIDEYWISRFSEGLWSALDECGVELIGGNTTRGPLAIAITAFGELPPGAALLRSGARPGDELWVSGALGDAGWALYCMIGDIKAEASADQIAKYEMPQARVALGIALRGVASSCIDVSDGLLSEAAHIASASGVTVEIDFASIPTGLADVLQTGQHAKKARYCLLSTGDAYELLFTAPPNRHDHVLGLLSEHSLDGACIGRVHEQIPGEPVRVLDAQLQKMDIKISGWDHFA